MFSQKGSINQNKQNVMFLRGNESSKKSWGLRRSRRTISAKNRDKASVLFLAPRINSSSLVEVK